MKLSYRGVSYESNSPTLEVTEGEILGKYRGTNWRCHTLQELPASQPNLALTYRGVAYSTGQTAGTCPADIAQVAAQSSASASIPMTLPVLKEIAKVHHANLQRNLERRLQIARDRGDQHLVHLLEAESKQLAV